MKRECFELLVLSSSFSLFRLPIFLKWLDEGAGVLKNLLLCEKVPVSEAGDRLRSDLVCSILAETT